MTRPIRLAAFVVATIALVGACGDDAADPTPTVAPADTAAASHSPATAPGSVVPLVSVEDAVAFYPACGNETLEHDGVTWSPIVHVGSEPMPELRRLLDEVLAVEREPWPFEGSHGLARVAPPGPGDDVGTLAIWADGVARWRSDSGTLDVWMVDDEVEYRWVC